MGATKHDQFLKISNAKIKFDAFVRSANVLGFSRISPGREARNQIMQKVSPPNSPRIKGVLGQEILQKEVGHYVIRVITTFNAKYEAFPKSGKFWVRITTLVKPGEEKALFTWKTPRTGDFLERALKMMEILSIALEQRPYDYSDKKLLAKLECLVETEDYRYYNPYIWRHRGANKEGKDTSSFISAAYLPERLREFYNRWLRDKYYYETVRRKKEGYKRREREVRKPYTRGVDKQA